MLTLRLVTANTVEERILSAAGVKLDKDALVIKSGMFYDSGNDLEDERRNRCVFVKMFGCATGFITPCLELRS